MKNRIKNLKIRGKFTFLASIIIGLFAFLSIIMLGAFGYINIHESKTSLAYAENLENDLDIAKDVRTIQAIIGNALYYAQIDDDARFERAIKDIDDAFNNASQTIDKSVKFYTENFGANHKYTLAIKEVDVAVTEFNEKYDELVGLLSSHKKDEAIKFVNKYEYLLYDALDAANERRSDSISGINNFMDEISQLTIIILISLTGLTIVTFIISMIMAKKVSKVVDDNFVELSESVRAIAEGDFQEVVALNQKDEIGDLSRNIAFAADTILTLIEDMKHSVNDFVHEGVMNPALDENKYVGDYKDLSITFNGVYENVNETTEVIFDSLNKIVDGDFNLDIPEYPGEKVVINENFDHLTLKINLISSEIQNMVTLVSNGELSERADTDQFNGKWKEILEGFNLLTENINVPFAEFREVLAEVGKGNLNVAVEGDFNGEFKVMSDSINETVKELSKYISVISTTLNEISHNKNLDLTIDSEFLGDFDKIKVAINTIIETYNAMFRDFLATANELTDVAVSLTDGSVTVATGASEQVTTLNQLNTTISLVSANTKENADSSQKANQISATSRENAINGDIEMKTMLSAMEEIKSASSDIANIIKVIDDIAFQTNLLALNAAVEAAHAGQHGRGFAVVAEEVGNLASRSKVAAEQTSALIKKSLEKVELGSQLANSTASTLNDILGNVTDVSSLLEEISGASSAQATSLSEISESLKSFENIVQTYTATSEQSVATSEELSAQAEELRSLLANFTLRV